MKKNFREEANKKQGTYRKLNNGGHAVDNPNGVTKYYEDDHRYAGSQGVDKSSAAYRMCGGNDD